MSRNATASWSGYSHQGKIGLLVALRKINSLHGNELDLNTLVLQYERWEDVSISDATSVLDVHQVKAKINDTTIGSYTEALAAFENQGTNRWIHTICEITNWADLTVAQNPRAVLRYEYPDGRNYCPLTAINMHIDSEIHILLTNENHAQADNANYRNGCYQDYLTELDDRIRYEHNFHAQVNYDVQFSLEEVRAIFMIGATGAGARLGGIREGIYKAYLSFLEDLDAHTFTLLPPHEANITEAIKCIYYLPNDTFIKFLKNINPHTSGGIKFEQCTRTDLFFVEDSFYSVFLNTIIRVVNCQYNLDTNTIPNFQKDIGYLVTSIASGTLKIKQHAKSILENTDIDFTAYENDYIITEHYEGFLLDHAEPIIGRGSSGIGFMEKNKMQFIKVDDAINNLNS